MSAQERFWSKVHQDGDDNVASCWKWTAAKTRAGYGAFRTADNRIAYAHRLSWASFHGAIPPGLQLDHTCRQRDCVNPFHLEPVTALVNSARKTDRDAYGHQAACINGHSLTGANLYIHHPEGRRGCRICRRLAVERHKARAK